LLTGWFYLDAEGNKHGPFLTTEMKDWFMDGYFSRELKVKRVYEEDFSRIGDREEFKNLKQKVFRHLAYSNDLYADPNWTSLQTVQLPPTDVRDEPIAQQSTTPGGYSQTGAFMGGKYQPEKDSYWKKKGLPEDKDGRMMSHYFNMDAYQEQMRNAKQQPPKKRIVTKKMKQYYKKKKEERKKRRIQMI
jgi:hypothetical protein